MGWVRGAGLRGTPDCDNGDRKVGRVQPLCPGPELHSGFLGILVQSVSPSVKWEHYSSPYPLHGRLKMRSET